MSKQKTWNNGNESAFVGFVVIMAFDKDFVLVLQLSVDEDTVLPEQFLYELQRGSMINSHTYKMLDIKNKEDVHKKKSCKEASIVDPTWEYIDPTPDIHALFTQFDDRFFWGQLRRVEVRWSPTMTSCAGICCYEGRGGLCSVRLSFPLLKFRPRKDLVETLLHEMIHAYLFVTHNNRDRDGHGPEFHEHMFRINREAGTNITVYHTFHEEVRLYQQHWWRCNGPCQKRPPYFGMVKRAMNRAPGPNDFWWKEHQSTCGGSYIKIREPPGFSEKKAKQNNKKGISASPGGKGDIRNFFPFRGKGHTLGNGSTYSGSITNKTCSQPSNKLQSPLFKSSTSNITGFRDLFSKHANAGKSRDKQKTNDSTKTFTDASKQNGGLFLGSSPKQSGYGDKAHATSAKNKDSVRAGSHGGLLANKGGSTLVITVKGSNKSVPNVKMINGNLNCGNKLISNFVPFSGKGHTVGTGHETKEIIYDRNSGTLTSDSAKNVRNSVFHEDSSQVLDNRTLHTGVKANKRHGSAAESDGNKKVKNRSILDLTTDVEEHSPSSDNTVKCPVCNSHVRELDINTHLDSCLGTSIVDDGPKAVKDSSFNLETDCTIVECPACNSEILKCDLNIHLDMCLRSVFESTSVDDDGDDDVWEDRSSVDMKPGDSAYPCPYCAAVINSTDMNKHLPACLPRFVSGTLE